MCNVEENIYLDGKSLQEIIRGRRRGWKLSLL